MADLWFFLKLFKPHRAWLIGGIVLALLTAFAAIGLLTLSGWFITASAVAGLGPDALAFNFMLPAAQIRAFAIARTLGRYGERVVTHEATFRILAGVRGWFFRQLTPLAPGRLSTLRSGDLLSRMTADIDALDALYLRLLAPAVVAAVGIIGVTALLSIYAPVIGLTNALMLLIASVWSPWLFNRLGREGAEEIVVLTANFRIRQLDLIHGLADLIANGAYRRYADFLGRFSDLMIDIQRRNNLLSAVSSALTLLLSQLAMLIALVLAAVLFKDGLLSGPDAALAVFCVIAAFELAAPLPQAMQMLGKTQTAARRIREVAEMTPTVTAPAQPSVLPGGFDLRLEKLSFSYPAQQRKVLEHIDLDLPQGRKIAIVGPSGSGKTTLLHLLMRYFDPELGRVLLDGQDIRAFDADELMRCFGVLSQRSQLFAATIRENLLIAKPDANIDELQAAINAAGLANFISRLPEGLETWVGESGVKVSGGEARRIALARLYLKNAPVLILDEPTEGLDGDTERDVFAALADFAKDKTLIMVTHREAGLSLADQVYRMERGVLLLL